LGNQPLVLFPYRNNGRRTFVYIPGLTAIEKYVPPLDAGTVEGKD
jgi:hypothetical protein